MDVGNGHFSVHMQASKDDTPMVVKREKTRAKMLAKKRHIESSIAALHKSDDDDNHAAENNQKQLVIFNTDTRSAGREALQKPVSADCRSLSVSSFPSTNLPTSSSRVLPFVGAFAVQCAECFKWRLIPTKEKYEGIRENILQDPFYCEKAQEWRPDASCEDSEDISQDGSRLWAIDKPNIPQPPPGWERILRIRGEGCVRFADVYYAAPSGKRLRSTVEIRKYLVQHPEYVNQGVDMSQFSFQIPRPLQENYVRKRTICTVNPSEISVGSGMPFESAEVNTLSLPGPEAGSIPR